MTLYWYSNSDSNWNTIASWFEDYGCSIPHGSAPSSGDDCVILASVVTPQIPTDSYTIPHSIDCTANPVAFYGSGTIHSCIIHGDTYFYENTGSWGNTVVGNVFFHDNCWCYSNVTGDGSFYGNSGLYAAISGSCNFNGASNVAAPGEVYGVSTFYNSSFNIGHLHGNANVFYPVSKPLGGTVDGSINYFGYPLSLYWFSSGDSVWNNAANWWLDNAHSVGGSVPTSIDSVTILASAHYPIFNSNSDTMPATIDTVNTTQGLLSFSGSGIVHGDLNGSADFYDSTTFVGTLNGNAYVHYPVAKPIGGTIYGSITYIGYPSPPTTVARKTGICSSKNGGVYLGR